MSFRNKLLPFLRVLSGYSAVVPDIDIRVGQIYDFDFVKFDPFQTGYDTHAALIAVRQSTDTTLKKFRWHHCTSRLDFPYVIYTIRGECLANPIPLALVVKSLTAVLLVIFGYLIFREARFISEIVSRPIADVTRAIREDPLGVGLTAFLPLFGIVLLIYILR